MEFWKKNSGAKATQLNLFIPKDLERSPAQLGMFFELWSSDRWKPFASFYFSDVSQAPKIVIWSSGKKTREPKLLDRVFLFQKLWKDLRFSSRGILNYGPPLIGSLCFTTFSILPNFINFVLDRPISAMNHDESTRKGLRNKINRYQWKIMVPSE